MCYSEIKELGVSWYVCAKTSWASERFTARLATPHYGRASIHRLTGPSRRAKRLPRSIYPRSNLICSPTLPATLAALFPSMNCGERSGIIIQLVEPLTKSRVVSSGCGKRLSLTPSILATCWPFADMAI